MTDETSVFDAEKFLHATTTEAGTRRPPLTAGIDYIGVIGAPKFRNVQGKKDPSKAYVFCDMLITIDLTANPVERDRIGQDKVVVQYSTGVDFNSTGLDWSPGKNRGLTSVRDATGTNVKGHSFSPAMLEGRQVRVKIRHEEYPEGSGELQDRVAGVAKP
jgi:hypothetical protein